MINNIIEVRCKHCNKLTKIDVKSITQLQNRIRELEIELATYKDKGSSDFRDLRNIFGMK
jgi:hypothetical protein